MVARRPVFLSYRSLERAFALRLGAALRNAGVELWIDCLPEGIRAGDDWPRTLEEALNSCRALIPVLSPDYVTSKVCLRELHRADQLARPILPVLLRTVSREKWPLEVERLQYVDFSLARTEDAFRVACNALVARLQGEVADAVGQAPDSEQRYLLALIAELEAHGGVSQYVALGGTFVAGHGEENDEPAPAAIKDWGLEPEFRLLAHSAAIAKPATENDGKTVENILQLVAAGGRLVLLGEPGAGKTTTLRRLALEAARARLENPRTHPLPLLAKLSDWQREPDPLAFVAARWPFESPPEEAIASGDVALFLDGLNEIGPNGRARAVLLREWLASLKGPRRLVATCRARDYREELDLGIDEVTVSPMDDARIRKFAESYLGADSPSFLRRILPEQYVATSRDLLSLARNPFLLTCLLVLHRSSVAGELPRNSGALFARVVPALWARERLRRSDDLPFDRAEAGLAALAFRMIKEGLWINIPVALAEEYLDHSVLDRALGASLVVGDEENLRFYHQIIQEYFAAVELRRRGAGEVLGKDSPRWAEVLISLSGIVENGEAVVRQVSGADPLLAGRCVLSGVDISPEFRAALIGALCKELSEMAPHIIRQQLEMYPEMGSSSRHVMEDAVESYFERCPAELAEVVHRVESGRLSLRR